MSTGPPPKRLGRLPSPPSADRARRARHFDRAALPVPPASYDWTAKVSVPWGMMLNDTYGDCAIAAPGHMVMAWTANAGFPAAVVPDATIEGFYFDTTGGQDSGCNMQDVTGRLTDPGLGGHKVAAVIPVDPTDDEQVFLVSWLFGGLYVGANLPNGATDGRPWTSGMRGNIGGHAVPILASSGDTETVITWGDPLSMSRGFRHERVDEAYGLLSTDFFGPNGYTPHGFMPSQMASFVGALGGVLKGILPKDPTPPVPLPPPAPVGPDFSGLV